MEQNIAGYRMRIECEISTKKRYRKLHGYVWTEARRVSGMLSVPAQKLSFLQKMETLNDNTLPFQDTSVKGDSVRTPTGVQHNTLNQFNAVSSSASL